MSHLKGNKYRTLACLHPCKSAVNIVHPCINGRQITPFIRSADSFRGSVVATNFMSVIELIRSNPPLAWKPRGSGYRHEPIPPWCSGHPAPLLVAVWLISLDAKDKLKKFKFVGCSSKFHSHESIGMAHSAIHSTPVSPFQNIGFPFWLLHAAFHIDHANQIKWAYHSGVLDVHAPRPYDTIDLPSCSRQDNPIHADAWTIPISIELNLSFTYSFYKFCFFIFSCELNNRSTLAYCDQISWVGLFGQGSKNRWRLIILPRCTCVRGRF